MKECSGSGHLWSMHDNLHSHAECFFVVVEHVVANLSMVLVRENDDRLLSVIFFLCVHVTHFLYYT